MKWLAELCGTCDMTANLQFMKENLHGITAELEQIVQVVHCEL